MTPQSVLTFGREALTLLLMVSLPVLLTVLVMMNLKRSKHGR